MTVQNISMSFEANLKESGQLHLDILRHSVLILKLMKREISLIWRSREEREGSSIDVVGLWSNSRFCYVYPYGLVPRDGMRRLSRKSAATRK
jgi:hypothetical protein